MATLGFVLAAFLDPVQAGIVLAVVLVHRGALPIIVAGGCAALASETVMAFAADRLCVGRAHCPAHGLRVAAGCGSLVCGAMASLVPQRRQGRADRVRRRRRQCISAIRARRRTACLAACLGCCVAQIGCDADYCS